MYPSLGLTSSAKSPMPASPRHPPGQVAAASNACYDLSPVTSLSSLPSTPSLPLNSLPGDLTSGKRIPSDATNSTWDSLFDEGPEDEARKKDSFARYQENKRISELDKDLATASVEEEKMLARELQDRRDNAASSRMSITYRPTNPYAYREPPPTSIATTSAAVLEHNASQPRERMLENIPRDKCKQIVQRWYLENPPNGDDEGWARVSVVLKLAGAKSIGTMKLADQSLRGEVYSIIPPLKASKDFWVNVAEGRIQSRRWQASARAAMKKGSDELKEIEKAEAEWLRATALGCLYKAVEQVMTRFGACGISPKSVYGVKSSNVPYVIYMGGPVFDLRGLVGTDYDRLSWEAFLRILEVNGS